MNKDKLDNNSCDKLILEAYKIALDTDSEFAIECLTKLDVFYDGQKLKPWTPSKENND